jgi:hypothetical protein
MSASKAWFHQLSAIRHGIRLPPKADSAPVHQGRGTLAAVTVRLHKWSGIGIQDYGRSEERKRGRQADKETDTERRRYPDKGHDPGRSFRPARPPGNANTDGEEHQIGDPDYRDKRPF